MQHSSIILAAAQQQAQADSVTAPVAPLAEKQAARTCFYNLRLLL